MLSLEVRALLGGHGMSQPDPLDALPAPLTDTTPLSPPSLLMPLNSMPQLSSRTAAAVKVYLDFTGAAATPWGNYSATETPAYDTDGDPTTFSQYELGQIRQIWSRVAEKYSPFNVDVTTVDPQSYAFNHVVRVVIGGNGSWAGKGFGGFGYVNGFTGDTSNTAWVFAKNLSGEPKYVAEAAAHETGHNFGLYHQSVYGADGNKCNEYNPGSGISAPIMGSSHYADRGLWWSGASSASNTNQDDVGIISSFTNGFGFRDDDHGNNSQRADVLTLSSDGLTASGNGVIETIADVDYFKITSPGGHVDFRADVAPYGAMLDLALKVTDVDGNILASVDTASLGEHFSMDTVPGDYYLAVSSHGDYGDMGQYSVTVSMVPEPVAVPLVLALTGGWLFQRPRRCGFRRVGKIGIAEEAIAH